jgi:hypothetical protein
MRLAHPRSVGGDEPDQRPLGRIWRGAALMMGMEDIILDRISFGSVKELRELYEA